MTHGARAMDLHAWIAQQVDQTELVARRASSDLGTVLNQIDYQDDAVTADEQHIMDHAPAAVLRRCEADRRILARHRLDPNVTFEPACEGCGTYGDCDMSNVDNINDCPELLDLAHAHGLTDDILAGLDRPRPPEPTPAQKRRLRERARLIVPITTSDVPEALRGTRWKP